MESLTLTRPDDMHVHLREGDALKVTVPATAKQFARAIVMPNLKTPITSTAMAQVYYDQIMLASPVGFDFQPLMTLYLTPELDPAEIRTAKDSGIVHGVKLYPQGATTLSEQGVKSLAGIYPVLEKMQMAGLPLLIHGEAVGDDIDIFDREEVFIEKHLVRVHEQFPELKIVLEHITTQAAVDFVTAAGATVAATITPHHLRYDRNAMLEGGLKPHLYCMPILKRAHHRQALIGAATSGNPKFFLGTDSAPHARSRKESPCGCAGVFSALTAMELYAEIFAQADALDKLEAFASHFGADFYGLPRNEDTLTLTVTETRVPESIPYLDDTLVPMCAGEVLRFGLSDR